MHSTSDLAPPSSHRIPTCRYGQMSKWRQKGFVQDSDEDEEESQLESQGSRRNAALQGRVERADDLTIPEEAQKDDGIDAVNTTEAGGQPDNAGRESVHAAREVEFRSPVTRRLSPRRPTASPLTPAATYDARREPTESPDPLQASPKFNPRRGRHNVSSQLQDSPSFTLGRSRSEAQQHDEVAIPPRIPSETSPLSYDPISNNVKTNTYGIESLSDDDTLSDPPTDLESPETGVIQAEPHRRTAIQIVIPSSTALQKHLYEQESTRAFRQRKPIQLHPYALEGELYRREVQSRGLKPVPRPRSPERRASLPNAETQEKDFDPNETPDSSPPELEIPVSTPIVRRPREDKPHGSSIRSRVSDPARRRLPATQLQLPNAAKRRRLNAPLTQSTAVPTSIFDEEDTARRDIWSIPPNSPPYSSSPLLNGQKSSRRPGRVLTTIPAPNLPTPSASSVFQDEPQLLPGSDLDQLPPSATQSGDRLRRPTRIILSDLSSSSSESSSDAEKSDNELKKVGKKIKGVLPASWLRFDQQAQARRNAQAKERERARHVTALSPEPSEPQRGIAQRVFKRNDGGGRTISSTPAENIVIISDGSDNENEHDGYSHTRDLQTSVEDATALATAFDHRYAADDSDNMEDDRLDLFTLGGTGAKRKRQTKITDSLGKAKRQKTSNGMTRKPDAKVAKKRHHVNSRGPRRTPPPAMSVVDLDLSPSQQGGSVPHFLRVARRQALRRPDLGRQSLRFKQIRLHNARDTEDANDTLQQWELGVLKPKANVRPRAKRSPLANKVANQQLAPRQTPSEQVSHKDRSTVLVAQSASSHDPSPRERASVLDMFQRTPTLKASQRAKRKPLLNRILERSARGALPTFRTGQLEGDESVFGHGHRKIAFEKGLRHADNQTPVPTRNNHSYMNPQLARFLADDEAPLPPLPTAKDVVEEQVRDATRPVVPSRRRLIRKKMQVQRIDVDTREYRQPSEPTVQEILSHHSHDRQEAVDIPKDDGQVLQGLGPYGTRYPTTFDVTCLQADTYFHSSTLVGSDDLRRALSIGQSSGRDMDEPAGYCTIAHDSTTVRCGPWNDETKSALQDVSRVITASLDSEPIRADEGALPELQQSLKALTQFLRSLMNYISNHLSFSDPVDRKAFVVTMHQVVFSLFDQISVVRATSDHMGSTTSVTRGSLRVMVCLLVLSVQTCRISQNTAVDLQVALEARKLAHNIAKNIVANIVRTGISELGNFLEHNKRHAARLNGVQEEDALVEGVVVCMHVLDETPTSGQGFWDIVSQELSSSTSTATHINTFETAWATLFTLVPFIEVDISGIPVRDRRESFSSDSWIGVSVLLRRLFELYPSTYKKHGSSLNDYIRANVARCHRLIKFWHWQRPEQMLNAVFDFFGKNGLRQLRRESTSGSVAFFDHAAAEALEPNESSFHIALKCLVLGLRGMERTYTEKKIRSFVFRTIPNHGRSYPKDQPLDEESLAALRNHHDLLCTLYWAAPPPCRPKLELIRSLVSHENSHREACRVNVRAWAHLATFQLSTDEPYTSAKPFALWHKDIMHQTLRQYQLAKTEADDYLKSGVLDGTTDVSAIMVRQTMERNQEQVIATLRDCIAGTRKAMQSTKDQTAVDTFLVDSDTVHLLELPHLEDRRLVNVIRDILVLLQEHAKSHKSPSACTESQQPSEESQDYGDFPDMDDFDNLEAQPTDAAPQQVSLDFIQTPLWHLLSNAFGAEMSPDDNLLMDCVDTWVLVAGVQVSTNVRSWSYYLESFSQVSWQQLRQTEQTRKFGPYFMARLMDTDFSSYEQHRHDFNTALLLSLVDRESLLRFQHCLLDVVVRMDGENPLMRNLPFFRNPATGEWDITSDTIRSRRLALVSSILSNMRDDLHITATESPARTVEVRRTYATMLKDLMTRMKSNYLQLQQGATITGTYVEFVQKVVQFLKQYTGDICPVIPFFTDSLAFPLPSTDPTYVVGRLCGYAPKAMEPGTAKQLSVFIQTVAQQAAADNQQFYLVNQLTTALCSAETPVADRATLRSVLLQGVFPTYLEKAFSSNIALLIARPIIQCLRPVLDSMMFDLRIMHSDSVSLTVESILAVAHAFIRGTEQLKEPSSLLERPHVLAALHQMLQALMPTLPLLEYIFSRTMTTKRSAQPAFITYMKEFSMYIQHMLHGLESYMILDHGGHIHTTPSGEQHTPLLAFGRRGLEDSLKTNWSESGGTIWFGQGHAKREVVFDIGGVDEEKSKLLSAVEEFRELLGSVYGEEDSDEMRGSNTAFDVVV
jgi:hypothetical protein